MNKQIVENALNSDFKDFKKSEIAVLTPESFLKLTKVKY